MKLSLDRQTMQDELCSGAGSSTVLVDGSRNILWHKHMSRILNLFRKKWLSADSDSKLLLSDEGNILKGCKCAMNQTIPKCKLNRQYTFKKLSQKIMFSLDFIIQKIHKKYFLNTGHDHLVHYKIYQMIFVFIFSKIHQKIKHQRAGHLRVISILLTFLLQIYMCLCIHVCV